MNTRDFKDIVEDRLSWIKDTYEFEFFRIRKERLKKNMELDLVIKNEVDWSSYFTLIETIDVIGQQTGYEPHVLCCEYSKEVSVRIGGNLSRYSRGGRFTNVQLRLSLKFLHNDKSK